MTSEDIRRGFERTLAVAHKLHAELRRLPSPREIQWRLATSFQASHPVEGAAPLTRVRAMELAAQMMDVISTAVHATQEETHGN